MNGPAHPAWCAPDRCEVGLGGAHSSTPAAVDFDRNGSAVVRLRIWQRPDFRLDPMDRHTPEPFVELVAGSTDTGHRCRADLTARHTLQLESLLGALIGQIGGES